MATTFVEYTGDGNATKQFTFPSYQESDVKVRVDGVLKTTSTHYNITSYTTTGGGNVVFTSGNIPSSPAKIRIYRDTSVDVAKATYTAGSSVKAADLNNNNTQLLYRAQEEQVPNLIQSYDIAASAIETSNIKADAITGAKIADDAVDTEHLADNAVGILALAPGAVTRAKLEADVIDSTKIENGAVGHEHLQADSVRTDKIQDNAVTLAKLGSGALPTDITVASANIVNGTIIEEDVANSAITANKLADNAVTTSEILNGAVTRDKIQNAAVNGDKIATDTINSEHYVHGSIDTIHIAADQITSALIADDQINSEHYVDGSIDRAHLSADIIDSTKIENGAIGHEHLQADAVRTAKIQDNAVTIDKIADGNIVTQSEQASHTVNDNTFFTTAAAEARFFNVSSGETIKDGDTFPDNDNTIATTAAINDRIIDIVNDVGGFDIVESEQHFPNTNPQGQAGSAAVLSVKAASTNLVPSGTTLTIVNGNLANNANITITGVTSTIPSGFGFIVESTGTLHTYTFHRLVPKATEVTTVAGKATEIGRLGTAAAVEDMSILGTADVVADLNTLGTADVVADMNMLATSDVVSDMNTLAVASVLSDMDTVATNVTNVNNVGNNVTNVNSVSNSAGSNQTFTVTVQNVSGNKYFIDTVQTPVLKLARGKTYTFDMSDSSNSGHPLAFRDSSDNSYTTGVTTSGTAGSSGATVVIVVAANAPSSLKYYCTSHGNGMGNTITVIDDNVGIVAGSITNVNLVGGDITNVNTTASSISNVNTVATNINNVNDFFDKYRVGSNNPTSSLDTGDLFFNTSSNSLKVYTGSAWVDGVTTTGDFALKTGNTFTGNNIFNAHTTHNDNVQAKFGTGGDLQLFHNGTNSFIQNNTNNLYLRGASAIILENTNNEDYIAAFPNGSVDLYYDNSKKFFTISNGVQATNRIIVGEGTAQRGIISGDANGVSVGTIGDLTFNLIRNSQIKARIDGNDFQIPTDNGKIELGAGQDLQIYHDGTNSKIVNTTGHLKINAGTFHINNAADNESLALFSADGAVELFYDNSKKFETASAGVKIDSQLELFHYGGTNFIRPNSGSLDIITPSSSNNIARFIPGGAVKLFHNASEKLETTSTGVSVTGGLTASGASTFNEDVTLATTNGSNILFDKSNNSLNLRDNVLLKFGTSGDCEFFHDGTNTRIREIGTGHFYVDASQFIMRDGGGTENKFKAITDGAVELYYDSSKKFETTSDGTLTTGTAQVTKLKVNSVNADINLTSGQNSFTRYGAINHYHNNSTSTPHNQIFFNARNGSNGRIRFFNMVGGTSTERFRIDSVDGIQTYAHLTPATDSTYNLGSSSLRFANAYVDTYYGDGSNLTGINTDLVSDTSPQLGGDLDTNGHEISLDDNHKVKFGAGDDLQIYSSGTMGHIKAANDDLRIETSRLTVLNRAANETLIDAYQDNAVQLWYDNNKKVETFANGLDIVPGQKVRFTHANASDANDGTISSGVHGEGLVFVGCKTNSSGTREIQHYGRIRPNDNNATSLGAVGQSYGQVHSIRLYMRYDGNNVGLYIGNGDDIRGYHDGTNSYFTNKTGNFYIGNTAGAGNVILRSNNQNRWHIDGSGHFLPDSNNNFDIGSSVSRVRNLYTNDLHLSNKGSSNDMDGTWGDWTIQEGESDLFLKNNRSGKKYKFNLMEVS